MNKLRNDSPSLRSKLKYTRIKKLTLYFLSTHPLTSYESREPGVFSQPTLWELIISPVSSSCNVVPYLPISAFSQVWCPHLFTNTGPLHVRTAGTASLTAAMASPAFILALSGSRAFTFGPFECWVCGPDTSKCRGPNWAKWVDKCHRKKSHFLWSCYP